MRNRSSYVFYAGGVGGRRAVIAPSSAPVCALGHLPPEGKAGRILFSHTIQPELVVGGGDGADRVVRPYGGLLLACTIQPALAVVGGGWRDT